jgi:hypothetical protein
MTPFSVIPAKAGIHCTGARADRDEAGIDARAMDPGFRRDDGMREPTFRSSSVVPNKSNPWISFFFSLTPSAAPTVGPLHFRVDAPALFR